MVAQRCGTLERVITVVEVKVANVTVLVASDHDWHSRMAYRLVNLRRRSSIYVTSGNQDKGQRQITIADFMMMAYFSLFPTIGLIAPESQYVLSRLDVKQFHDGIVIADHHLVQICWTKIQARGDGQGTVRALRCRRGGPWLLAVLSIVSPR